MVLDFSLVGVLFFQGLLTFSRGGIIAAWLALLTAWFYQQFRGYSRSRMVYTYMIIIVLTALVWNYVGKITGRALQNRYVSEFTGETPFSATGRLEILKADLNIFSDNPVFGVGLSMAKQARADYGYSHAVAAHTEFSRLLAEHGSFGLLAFIILIILPIKHFFRLKNLDNRTILIVFFTLSVLTMLHSAMRLAMPGFVYGLAMIRMKENQ